MTDATSSIFQDLSKVEDALKKVVDALDNVKNKALGGGGVITKTMPTNIDAAISKVDDLLKGTGPYSINSLIDFITNVPMSGYSREVQQRAEQGGAAPAPAPAQPEIDTTPDMDGGPKSALAESMKPYGDYEQDSLKEFYRENFARKKHVRENADPFSWDAICDSDAMSDELDYDIGSVGDGYIEDDYIGDTPFHPTDYIPEVDEANQNYLEDDDYEFNEDDSELESQSLRDWRGMASGASDINLADLGGDMQDGFSTIQ